ncbi:hypothetical protein X753_30665 [Mesorhizobium sp. LNJC399B00]|nr:hypothetical protein X753_30665 [Mesorhizobium sp. LNJC399B00]
MQIFDRISSLIDADDCQAAIEDARALLLQFGQSRMRSHMRSTSFCST